MQVDFPFKKGVDGYFKRVPDFESTKTRLVQLLLTSPGERVGMPSFGVGIHRFLFNPLDSITAAELKDAIRSQVTAFEPGLRLDGVDVWAEYRAQPPLLYIRLSVTDLRLNAGTTYDFSVKYRNPLFK